MKNLDAITKPTKKRHRRTPFILLAVLILGFTINGVYSAAQSLSELYTTKTTATYSIINVVKAQKSNQ